MTICHIINLWCMFKHTRFVLPKNPKTEPVQLLSPRYDCHHFALRTCFKNIKSGIGIRVVLNRTCRWIQTCRSGTPKKDLVSLILLTNATTLLLLSFGFFGGRLRGLGCWFQRFFRFPQDGFQRVFEGDHVFMCRAQLLRVAIGQKFGHLKRASVD